MILRTFFRLMNNSVSGKTMENLRRNQLVSERNYHTAKYFSEDLLAIEMKKHKRKK